MTLGEKYRPKTWAEVVGQDRIVATIQALKPRGLGGRAYWILGPSGVGKTTIARLLAAELADPLCVIDLDAGQMTPSRLAEIECGIYQYGMGSRNGRVYIINEAHGLRAPAIRQLLILLERLPEHVAFIFTTTILGQENLFEDQIDSEPLLSRCVILALSDSPGTRQAFARHAARIAKLEGLDGLPDSTYLGLCNARKGNLRALLQMIETAHAAKQ